MPSGNGVWKKTSDTGNELNMNFDKDDLEVESLGVDTYSADAEHLEQVAGQVSGSGKLNVERMVIETEAGPIELTAEDGKIVITDAEE